MAMNVSSLFSYSASQSSYKKDEVKEKKDTKNTQKAEKTDSTGKEKKLSKAAQKLLEKLRASHSNMDFMVADFENGDEAKKFLARATKEFSVIFSSEELEKMAADEKYYEEKMKSLDGAVRMSQRINEQFGFTTANRLGGGEITKIGISFNSDGTTTLFAELTKFSEKQREWLEKIQEKKADERTGQKADYQKGKRPEAAVEKRVVLYASTEEELIDKIRQTDWSKVKEEEKIPGGKFDFSI